MIGKTLAHYQISELIGRGGMGEVYRAHDARLGRDVALKVLTREFSDDPERQARFEREARTLATLQHPNIASVYGFEEAEGVRFLVMELAEGEDLGEYLARGISTQAAVEIATQIALGLEAAHNEGIVHRDLKPANVQIGPDGTVKLLDFGLARAWEENAGAADLSNSPTITGGMTAHGVIMGTAAYMSPEQARGMVVDRQADVWAFGCVLFEMLRGEAVFQGDTVTDTLAAIIHKEPDWASLPKDTPRHLLRLMELCLQKDPRERLRDARDLRLLLKSDPESPAEDDDAAPVRSDRVRLTIVTGIAAVLAVALVAVLTIGRSRIPLHDADGSGRLRVVGMEQLTDRVGIERDPNLSPDGRMLLFTARDDGGDFDVLLQRVGGENPINLTADHDGDDLQASFSPDGQRIAFSSSRERGGIFVMGATGETPLRVADFGFDPAWSPDGRKLVVTQELVFNPYSRSGMSNLWIVDLENRETQRLHSMDGAAPDWSPGGHRIAFWSHLETVKGQRDIYTIAADGTDPRAVTLDAATDWDPVWSPDGRWLFFLSDRGGTPDLWRVPIDERSGETHGPPQPVTVGTTRLMQVSVSDHGQIALMSSASGAEILSIPFDSETLRVTGAPVSVLSSNNSVVQLSASADGEWIAYRTTAPAEHIYVMRSDGSSRRRIVASAHRNRGPKFMPANDWIIFYSNRSDVYQLWAVRPDGSDLKQLTGNPEQDVTGPFITPDGRILATYEAPTRTLGELRLPEGGIAAIDTPLQLHALAETPDFTGNSVSSNSSWLAGSHGDDGTAMLYSLDSGSLESLSYDGEPLTASFPTWLDDHRLLFWAARLQSAAVWDAEERGATIVGDLPGPASYDVLPGKRQLVATMRTENSVLWLVSTEAELP